MNTSALVSKIDKLLSRFNPVNRQVYKRFIMRTGGDALLGRTSEVHIYDERLDPQPMLRPLPLDTTVICGESIMPATDCVLTVSSSAITRDELRNKDLVLVFREPTLAEEEYFIVAYAPTILSGEEILYTVLLRSKKRGGV